MVKTFLQGKVKEKRRGRQKKRGKDHNKKRTGIEIVCSARATENKTRWNVVVVVLFVLLFYGHIGTVN